MYAHSTNVANGTEAQLVMQDLLKIYPFHCYALASMQRYLLMDYYLDVDQAMEYAERAKSSCYYGAGRKYLDTAMRDLGKRVAPILFLYAVGPFNRSVFVVSTF